MFVMCEVSTVGGIIFLVLLVGGQATTNDYKSRLFRDPGLLWMDNIDDVVYFRHVYFDDITNLGKNRKGNIVARAMKGRHNFTHMDVDYGNRTVVMSDALTKSIMAMTFDDTAHATYVLWTLHRGTSTQVNGIAVDWTTDVVYWTDGMYDAIYGASMLLHNVASIIVDELENPYGIATYPHKGFLFWTEASISRRPRLMRSSLGGRNAKTILRFFDRTAYALHIDYFDERIYWVFTLDATRGIESCSLDGDQIITLKSLKMDGFLLFDVDTYNDLLLSLERNAAATRVDISRIRRHSIGHLEAEGVATGLKVLDPIRQYEISNMCEYSKCPGVCTKSNHSVDCFCVDHLRHTVDPTYTYCGAPVFSGLLVNKAGGIFSMPTNFADLAVSSSVVQVEPREVVSSSTIIKAMTSDIGTNKIYFYEYQSQVIKSVRMEPMAQPEVLSMAVEEVGGLAFDSMGRNLYWTDVKLDHIMVVDENGEYPVVLHDNLESPSAIAVHAGRAYRYLFWAEMDRLLRISSVWRSSLTGTSREPILTALRIRGIKGLAVDMATKKLYICGSYEVWVSDFNGNNSRELYFNRDHIFTGMTILHDYLVVSDTSYKSSGLHAFDKSSTEAESLVLVGKAVYPFYHYGNWFGVTYHHRSNQPGGSLCNSRTSSCDQLCLAGQRRHVRCACSLGYETEEEKCRLDTPWIPYLLVADQRYRKLFQIRHSPRSYVDIPVKAVRQPFSIAYDPVRRFNNEQRLSQVYWSDLETGTISRSYLDGSYQEVIVYDPFLYLTDLLLNPDSRLLFYLSRARGFPASLIVINVDTGLTKPILYQALEKPSSIAVSDYYGYLFIVEQSKIWRASMDGSELEQLITNVYATHVTVMDNYLFFTNISEGRPVYKPVWTHILRSDLNGDNITFLVELPGLSSISDLKADRNFLYWTNTKTRGVQYINRTGSFNVANIMPVDKLFRPSGLAVHVTDYKGSSRCAEVSCGGICLSTPYENVTCEDDFTQARIDTEGTDLCQIPEIVYGEVEGNEVGRVVPDGFWTRVNCFPMHQISNEYPITCINGNWSHIPHCILDYEICGTVQRGYKVYNKTGKYFVYPEMTKVHVIVIGGGGGGYDVSNPNITSAGKAGDGGNSSFGNLVATGGKGGTPNEGGKGGFGFSWSGDGSDPAPGNCTTGGTVGQARSPTEPDRPDETFDLFAGSGGYSDVCTKSHIESAKKYSGPGGTDGNAVQAGYFGGGAGGREGGAGGGGGWIRKTLAGLEPRQLVTIEVGKAGTPSYSPPGPGIVVVSWGDFQLDDFVEKKLDVLSYCVLD